MNILIVGSGGREHAIAKKLFNINTKLFCVGPYENPGISKYTDSYLIDSINTFTNIVQFIKKHKIGLVVIGPEKYLEMGLSDLMDDLGIMCVGPSKSFAKIETSKAFLRDLMIKYKMEEFCPKYKIYSNTGNMENMENMETMAVFDFIKILGENFVVKYDGLRGGKGVKVSGIDFSTTEEGLTYCQTLDSYVIEEKLIGEEFSLMSFCDGVTLKHMPPIKDYKRALDDNKGKQTGGMGCISFPSFLTQADINTAEKINFDVIAAISRENRFNGYKGIIYGSFIKTQYGIKVIEYNARFGDPECILALHMLEGDLEEIFMAISTGTLDKVTVSFTKEKLVCRYLVPQGYPTSPKHGQVLKWADIDKENITLASVSVDKVTKNIKSLSSRTMAFVGKDANDLSSQLETIKGDFYFRRDIGLTKTLYEDAGVNIDEGTKVVEKIAQCVKDTHNANVLSAYGSFGGLYSLNNTTLVASTDGVGTKTKFVLQKYSKQVGLNMLGHDIVNHCVNDILVEGAIPEFFMDYFAASKIDSDDVCSFVQGVAHACKQTNCVLLGGETAEMPGIYTKDSVEIVGTIVGSKKYKFMGVKKGNIVMALPSASLHTNGYSLVRKILEGKTIPDHMLTNICAPHRAYLKDIIYLIDHQVQITGLCHITGGGLIENPKRVLPKDCDIAYKEWEIPEIFNYLEYEGNLCRQDMLKTFNMGIGMMVFINNNQANEINDIITSLGMFDIGTVV